MSSGLVVKGLSAGYSGADVLHEVSFTIGPGETFVLVGANGAGKSTLLRTISGLLKARRGTIEFDGRRIEGARPTAISRLGVTHVPEGRRVFAEHTVEDNLLLGGYPTKKGRASLVTATAAILERFPQLVNRRRDVAGALSGGQQQMLAIAMGLMANPKLLMLDEPSLGLAPIVVYEVYQQISMLRDSGVTVLLVDQLADQALGIADRAAALRLGEIIAVGSGAELLGDAALRAAYLG